MTRAERLALEMYPVFMWYDNNYYNKVDANIEQRIAYKQGYKQAEEDTIERAVAWLKEHANDYIVNLTPTYPDAPVNFVVGSKCWDDLKEYLEEEK